MKQKQDNQQPRSTQRQQQQGGDAKQQRPQDRNNKSMKPPKKPVTKGSATMIAFVVSFILLLIFAVGLIIVAASRTASEQAVYNQTLSDAVNAVEEASSNVLLAPAQSSRASALSVSANITVDKDNSASTSTSTEGTEENANSSTTTTVYGSGVVISSDSSNSYVLTNAHVIESAKTITVTINDTEYIGEVSGSDATSDLAVIKISAKNIPVATIGASKDLIQGDYVMAIGNPYGQEDTMTVGIVSALDRNFTMRATGGETVLYADMIQTDSSISEGNSGGGLFNASGELVGINTLISTDTAGESAETFGYAIPIDLAIPIAQNLMAGTKASHPSLGLSLSDVSDDTVTKYGLTSNDGAYIVNVTASGPAATVGIVSGDIVVSYGGEKVENAQDLLYKIRASVINEQKEIKVLREGKEMTFNIKVGSDA